MTEKAFHILRRSLAFVFLCLFANVCVEAQTPRPVLYGINNTNQLIILDRDTLQETTVGSLNIPNIKGLAYDSTTRVLYGLTSDCTLIKINPLTARADEIQKLSVPAPVFCEAITVEHAIGQTFLYVTNAVGNHEFIRIEISATPPFSVNILGNTVFQVTGLAFHPGNGTLYAVNRSANALGILNKATGQFISSFSNAGINNPENITFDSEGNILLGVFSPSVVGTYNLTNGQATALGATTSVSALTLTPNFRAFARPLIVGEEIDANFESSHPYGDGLVPAEEVVTSFTIQRPGATYIAPHFKRFDLGDGDFVIVRDPANTRSWRFEGDGKPGLGLTTGFWGINIPGDTAIIELHRRGQGTRYGIQIKKYARGLSESETQAHFGNGGPLQTLSMCGIDDMVNAACLATTDLKAYSRTKPVARLLINGGSLCTGFLFGSNGHIVTNNHCIDTAQDAANTDFEFKAEGATCSAACKSQLACVGTTEATASTLIKKSATRDYALVSPLSVLNTSLNLTPKYGYIQARSSNPIINESIFIPEHPAGWGKQVAYQSTWPGDNGTPLVQNTGMTSCWPPGNPTPNQDIGYYADTLGGSSGSPVVANSDHLLVALHHCGTCLNRGVPIEQILDDLGASTPPCAKASDAGCTGSGLPNFTGSQCSTCQSIFDCLFGSDCVANQCLPFGRSGYQGETCCSDAHCLSGVCGADKKCTCITDQHCAAGTKCRKGSGRGERVCKQVATGADEECDSCLIDKECLSGDCFRTRCVTRAALGIGEKCCKGVQCETGSCRNGHCQCTKDSHCGDGNYCKKTPAKLNQPNECRLIKELCDRCGSDKECGPGFECAGKPIGKCIVRGVKLALEDTCCRDSQCSTGSCSNSTDKCQCTKDSHCGNGFFCDKGTLGIGRNTCEPDRAECAGCLVDSQCGAGAKCSGFKCQTKTKSVGESCCGDFQCRTGSCNKDNVCQCKSSGDCPSGQYCAEGFLGIGKNSCVSFRAECDSCALSRQCGPGAECRFGACATKNSKTSGQACCRDYQCTSGNCRRGQCR